jgi:hypothetical protein
MKSEDMGEGMQGDMMMGEGIKGDMMGEDMKIEGIKD